MEKKHMQRLIHIIKRRTMNSQGFTLLETMISLAVFAIGILGVMTLQTTSINSNTLAEDVQNNTVIAMGTIEELMATDFLDQRLPVPLGATYQANDPRYTITRTATDDTFLPGSMRVQITAQFTPTGGRTQTITLNIFKPDIDRVTPNP
jgi:prepilin-type N-terminal cleavage/methylation domain-containing protein